MSTVLEHEPGVETGSSTRRLRAAIWAILKDRPSAIVGAAVLALFVLVAVFAPLIAPHGLHERIGPPFGAPGAYPPLGLDDGGGDILSLLMWGARISLMVGFAASLVAIMIGGTVGVIAGYFGGVTDTVLMRITDYFLAIPDVPLMIVVAAIWGPSLWHIVLVIGLLLWTSTARIVRAQVKSVRERVYVKRARALGAGNARIIFRHVLPQVAPLLVANTVLTIAVAIFDETALAFLGLSDPSKISWGKMIKNATGSAAVSAGAWWTIVPPGVCVALVILACTLVGQALEDALNPRLRVAHLAARGFRLLPRMLRDDK
ncbi:MAG: peptide/nickel transport system permease protein [Actinomycetota bacterium]|jgi:peptide/nickel transport system permease protein|nr:peptide/nickel transport system permease protein [Actinomycetota bacterium]